MRTPKVIEYFGPPQPSAPLDLRSATSRLNFRSPREIFWPPSAHLVRPLRRVVQNTRLHTYPLDRWTGLDSPHGLDLRPGPSQASVLLLNQQHGHLQQSRQSPPDPRLAAVGGVTRRSGVRMRTLLDLVLYCDVRVQSNPLY